MTCVPDAVQRAVVPLARYFHPFRRGALLIRDRHKHRISGDPGSAAHHFVLRCARDTGSAFALLIAGVAAMPALANDTSAELAPGGLTSVRHEHVQMRLEARTS